MKNLTQFITEKLIVNKNYHNNTFDGSMFNGMSVEDILETIVKSAKKEPEIYDDTGDFDSSEAFEPWQDASGYWDRTAKAIEFYIDCNAVAGWFTHDLNNENFDDLDKIIPPMFKDIMNNEKSEIIYNKHHCQTELWRIHLGGHKSYLLKFNCMGNDYGRDFTEYWYMISIAL